MNEFRIIPMSNYDKTNIKFLIVCKNRFHVKELKISELLSYVVSVSSSLHQTILRAFPVWKEIAYYLAIWEETERKRFSLKNLLGT